MANSNQHFGGVSDPRVDAVIEAGRIRVDILRADNRPVGLPGN